MFASVAIWGLMACGADTVSPSEVVRIAVIPPTVTMLPSTDTTFFAFGITNKGDTGQVAATWSASAGSISTSGRYSAPSSPGTNFVYATVGTLKDSATVTVSTSPVVKIFVFPKLATVQVNDTLTFVAHGINSLSDTVPVSVLWSATGGSISLNGLWTAPSSAGTVMIHATNGALSDSAKVTVNAAGGPTEPIYNASVHTLVFPQIGASLQFPSGFPANQTGTTMDFSTYSTTAQMLGDFTSTQVDGSLNLDTAVGHNDSRSLRIDWANGGCLGASDANVGIQKRLGKQSDGVHYDFSNYRSGALVWVVSYWAKWQVGFVHTWSSGCARGNDQKEFILFRNPNNTGDKQSVLAEAANGRQCPIAADSQFNATLRWDVNLDSPDSGSTDPACGGPIYTSEFGFGSKDPASVHDDQWHHTTIEERKETSALKGDGLIRIWIDGVLVTNLDGTDPSNPGYQKTYTGAMPGFADPFIVRGIFNGGAPQAQSEWFDDLQIFFVTGS